MLEVVLGDIYISPAVWPGLIQLLGLPGCLDQFLITDVVGGCTWCTSTPINHNQVCFQQWEVSFLQKSLFRLWFLWPAYVWPGQTSPAGSSPCAHGLWQQLAVHLSWRLSGEGNLCSETDFWFYVLMSAASISSEQEGRAAGKCRDCCPRPCSWLHPLPAACAAIVSLHMGFCWKLLFTVFWLWQIQAANSHGSWIPVLLGEGVFWSLLHTCWGCVPPVCWDVVLGGYDWELWVSLFESTE